MNTAEKQNRLAKIILETNDESILNQIETILNNTEIIGYEYDGTPITKEKYIQEMDELNAEIDNGTAQLFTTDEVLKEIKNAYRLE